MALPVCSLDHDCSLEGLNVRLPSLEEEAVKRDKAFNNLRNYVQACGGSLPEGWLCSLRCRITSRRHGRQGLTTDNYYYSPCGKTFRTHKQVVEFLGLQPLSREQFRQQQLQHQERQHAGSDADLPESFNIISVTVLDPGSTVGTSSRAGSKRSHSAMTATDTAVDSPSPGHAQPLAVSAPAAFTGTCSQGVSDAHAPAHSNQPANSVQSAPASAQPYAVKRTKAALAAKYAGSANSHSAAAGSTDSTPVAAASVLAGLVSSNSSATQAMSMCASADTDSWQQPAADAGAGSAQQPCEQPQLQHVPAMPAVSSTTSSKSKSGSKAVSSRLSVGPAAQQFQPQQQPRQKQQQAVAKQPVPKPWKPRAQPAWRLKLRELATAAVLAEGLGTAPSRPAPSTNTTNSA